VSGNLPSPMPLKRMTQTKARSGAGRLRRLPFPYSDLDHPIPPEIVDDEFHDTIRSLAQTATIHTILEIGSPTGEGSTRAFLDGIRLNPNRPLLCCLEVSRTRFRRSTRRYAREPLVKCYELTSGPTGGSPPRHKSVSSILIAGQLLIHTPQRGSSLAASRHALRKRTSTNAERYSDDQRRERHTGLE
jgi:hypothetical protein